MLNSKNDIKRLISYALMFKKYLFFGLVFLLFCVVFELISPFIVKKIFDEELKNAFVNQEQIIKYLIYYILVGFTASIFEYLSELELKIMSMKIIQKMRMQMYSKLQELEVKFFDNTPAGSIVSKITNDTLAIQNLYVKVLGEIVKNIIYIISIYIVLFNMQMNFALINLFLVPIIYMIIFIYNKKAKIYNTIIREKISEINGSLNEIIQGISIIQAFNNTKKIEEDFEKISSTKLQAQKKMLNLNSLTSYNIISTLKNIAFTIMIYYFANRFLKDNIVISAGALYVYVDYLGKLFHHIQAIIEQVNEMSKSTVASNTVFEIIDRDVKHINNDIDIDIKGKVEFKNLSFYYKEGEYVLKNINIQAQEGEVIALVGHTGSGKSSVINLLLKFYDVKQGKILVDDIDLSKIPDRVLRKQMGIVLQEPYLFSGTVYSNISLGNDNITKEDAINALKMLGADMLLTTLRQGIDEEIKEKGSTLSSGQRQLISFARAFAHNPKILILDEATSSIDTQTEQIIQDAMKILMKGRTTFIIAHRLSTIKNADKIYMLDKGSIIEQGTHKQLMEKKGKYFEMYNMQNTI